MIKSVPQKKSQMEAKLLKINVKNGDPEVKSQKIKPKWATLVKEKNSEAEDQQGTRQKLRQ